MTFRVNDTPLIVCCVRCGLPEGPRIHAGECDRVYWKEIWARDPHARIADVPVVKLFAGAEANCEDRMNSQLESPISRVLMQRYK